MAEVLSVRGLVAGYGDNTVLHGVDLTLSRGTWTTIIGANGAGKSTLLKAVAGIVPLRAGRVVFEGRDLTGSNAVERLRGGLGHVPQGRCNFPLLTVAENLRLGGYTRELNDSQFRSESEALLSRFPRLRERWNVPAGNLSGGEQQLLEMAMVLMAKPRLLLLDEPSLGLAPGAMQTVFAIARSLADEGVTLLMVEQNARQALEHCDVGVVLDLGRVSLVEPAGRILEHPDIRRSFLGV